jgi:TPR repeat protein
MDDEIVPSNELKSLLIYSENNDYIDNDYIQRLIIFGNSKRLNDFESIYNLAQYCLYGISIQKHTGYGLILYKYAANLGHSNSQQALGDIYCHKINVVTRDYNEAYKWYLMSASQGNINAKIDIARMFIHSLIGNKTLDQAIAYLVDIANTGETYAQYYLGYTYQYKCKNELKAIEWYTISATNGYFLAQYQLGVLYKTSKSKIKNYVKSLKWFKAALANKHMYLHKNLYKNLGEIYEFGLGVDIDLIEAIKYYILGSNHDRIKNIIIKNSDKIGTIICDTDDKIKEQKKILDLQEQYIVELEYMPQGPKYKVPENTKTIKN